MPDRKGASNHNSFGAKRERHRFCTRCVREFIITDVVSEETDRFACVLTTANSRSIFVVSSVASWIPLRQRLLVSPTFGLSSIRCTLVPEVLERLFKSQIRPTRRLGPAYLGRGYHCAQIHPGCSHSLSARRMLEKEEVKIANGMLRVSRPYSPRYILSNLYREGESNDCRPIC